jgi:hypothetical protein
MNKSPNFIKTNKLMDKLNRMEMVENKVRKVNDISEEITSKCTQR